jgi:hypothetical protein
MAKRSKASYKAAAKKAAATRKRNAAAKKKRASAKRKTAPRRKVKAFSRPKGGCSSTWTRYRYPKGTVLNGKKVGGRFKTNKGRSPTGRRERALCPDTRTVR